MGFGNWLGRVLGRKTEGYPISSSQSASQFLSSPPGARTPVTEYSALNISAVWSAVRVITGATSILPLHVYRTDGDDDRTEVEDSPAARLAKRPNSEMTPVTFWETVVAHMLTWGNGYAEIERDGRGEPIGIWPIVPSVIRPSRDPRSGELTYEVSVDGRSQKLPARDVFHVPGLGFDGLSGYSVISMARRSLQINATAEQAGESFLAEGMRPGGVLEFPGSLQDLQKLNLEEATAKKHGGAPRFGKTLILYGGMKYNPLSIPPEDAQFLETREFQTEEVARWFNIPPHKLRDLRRATFSNIEHQAREFVADSLLYWLTKITQEFGRKLIGEDEPGVYAEHNLDVLLRGDTASRYAAYASGRQWGLLSPNDCRRKENMPPIEGGDVYHVPVNMAVLGAPAPAVPKSPPAISPDPDPAQQATASA